MVSILVPIPVSSVFYLSCKAEPEKNTFMFRLALGTASPVFKGKRLVRVLLLAQRLPSTAQAGIEPADFEREGKSYCHENHCQTWAGPRYVRRDGFCGRLDREVG